jgi:hypothetical protein
MVNFTPRPLYPQKRTPVPIEYGALACPRGGLDVWQKIKISLPLPADITVCYWPRDTYIQARQDALILQSGINMLVKRAVARLPTSLT